MVAAKVPSPVETTWWYQGADADIYGPFSGQAMLEWVRSGYFKDNLLVRTTLEENYHPLGDWARVLGNKLPFFFNNLTTFENAAMCAQSGSAPINALQPPFFYPPGLAPPHSQTTFTPPQFRRPNGVGTFFSPEVIMNNHQHPGDSLDVNAYIPSDIVSEPKPPSTRTIGTDPMPPSVKDEGTQTVPYAISKDQAMRILTELFGQSVQLC